MVNKQELEEELKKLLTYAENLLSEAKMSDLANQEYIRVQEQVRNLSNILRHKQ
jgi:ElaB/YqjD/DUF883 family membrane-anchored ribosome-binding protein